MPLRPRRAFCVTSIDTTAGPFFSYSSVKSGSSPARACASATGICAKASASTAQAAAPVRTRNCIGMEFLERETVKKAKRSGKMGAATAPLQRRATDCAIWRTVADGTLPSTVTSWSSLRML